jgi:small subunit ribosomal protein S9
MSSEERDDLPEEPSEEASEGVPGEPGEATPSEEEAGEAIGPEIEGVEELAEQVEAAAEEGGEAPEEGGEAPEEAEGEEAAPEAEGEPAEAPRERRPRRDRRSDEPEEEVIPGMHLEPDLVLEEERREESEFGQYAEDAEALGLEEAEEAPAEEAAAEPAPVVREPLDLAADARYYATGKRKAAVARVILRPGEGTYSVNGRHLDEYFPRVRLQRVARQPLEAAGYHTRLDVVARIHGGGVSAQATALRHGVARALVEADPALRGELKRRGYLTRDPREKERKKAGLKKARKRPQFSKR